MPIVAQIYGAIAAFNLFRSAIQTVTANAGNILGALGNLLKTVFNPTNWVHPNKIKSAMDGVKNAVVDTAKDIGTEFTDKMKAVNDSIKSVFSTTQSESESEKTETKPPGDEDKPTPPGTPEVDKEAQDKIQAQLEAALDAREQAYRDSQEKELQGTVALYEWKLALAEEAEAELLDMAKSDQERQLIMERYKLIYDGIKGDREKFITDARNAEEEAQWQKVELQRRYNLISDTQYVTHLQQRLQHLQEYGLTETEEWYRIRQQIDELNQPSKPWWSGFSEQISSKLTQPMEGFFSSIIGKTATLSNAFKSLFDSLKAELIKIASMSIVKWLLGFVTGGSKFALSGGGGLFSVIGKVFGLAGGTEITSPHLMLPLAGGIPSLVGESGPEIIAPSRNYRQVITDEVARIIPQGVGNHTTYQVNVPINTDVVTDGIESLVRDEVRKTLDRLEWLKPGGR